MVIAFEVPGAVGLVCPFPAVAIGGAQSRAPALSGKRALSRGVFMSASDAVDGSSTGT
jgi:hypothetical protein